jgi:hypothetical protein
MLVQLMHVIVVPALVIHGSELMELIGRAMGGRPGRLKARQGLLRRHGGTRLAT